MSLARSAALFFLACSSAPSPNDVADETEATWARMDRRVADYRSSADPYDQELAEMDIAEYERLRASAAGHRARLLDAMNGARDESASAHWAAYEADTRRAERIVASLERDRDLRQYFSEPER